MFACKVAVHAQVSSSKVGLLTTEMLYVKLMDLQGANSNSHGTDPECMYEYEVIRDR